MLAEGKGCFGANHPADPQDRPQHTVQVAGLPGRDPAPDVPAAGDLVDFEYLFNAAQRAGALRAPWRLLVFLVAALVGMTCAGALVAQELPVEELPPERTRPASTSACASPSSTTGSRTPVSTTTSDAAPVRSRLISAWRRSEDEPTTAKAIELMLTTEGFSYEGYIDIFDGGPTMCVVTDQVRGYQRTRLGDHEAIDLVPATARLNKSNTDLHNALAPQHYVIRNPSGQVLPVTDVTISEARLVIPFWQKALNDPDKAALHAGGFDFPGHTEMLRELTGVNEVAMLMAAEGNPERGPLRVVLAPEAAIEGRLVVAGTQQPVAGATVIADPGGRSEGLRRGDAGPARRDFRPYRRTGNGSVRRGPSRPCRRRLLPN